MISVGKLQAGDWTNVTADKAELAATIRTTSSDTRKLIENRVKTITAHIVKAHDANYDLNYMSNYPAIMNDPNLNEFARKSVVSLLVKRMFLKL